MWLYTDTNDGIFKVERGTVRFSDWYETLQDGKDYKAYLLSNDGYQVKAESERFTKKSGENYCSRRPTSPTRPAPRPSKEPTRRPVSTDDYYTNVDDDDDWGYGFDDDDDFDDDLGFDDNFDDGVDDFY